MGRRGRSAAAPSIGARRIVRCARPAADRPPGLELADPLGADFLEARHTVCQRALAYGGQPFELLVGADHNILWFGEELAGEEGFEPSIS